MMTPEQARELARCAVSLTEADEAEALVSVEHSALTRFANNRINQNVAEDNAQISVRAVLGTRVGVASTNRIDDASIAACCDAAVAAASIAPEDPRFPDCPSRRPSRSSTALRSAALGFDASARAEAVRAIVESSHRPRPHGRRQGSDGLARDRGRQQQGRRHRHGDHRRAGHGAVDERRRQRLGELPRHRPERPRSRGTRREAAELAVRSANPVDLDPGSYRVVLGPEAVADIMDFLGYMGFSAKAYAEDRSFMSNHLGDKVMSELVTIVDDAFSPLAMGATFDYEGVPKQRVALIDRGVAANPVTDSYWAAQTGRANTGHALPAPNSWGPMPLNIEMLPGDATLDELIGSVERGVYVTRFHYVNVEDPVPVTLTGMTRDGTFMIEDGRLTSPLKNLRFTQSAVEALGGCEGVTAERRFVGTEEGASLVPGILLASFNFTGQTS